MKGEMDSFENIKDHSNALIEAAKPRLDTQHAMFHVYNLDWDEKALDGKPDWVMDTKDPQPADSIAWLTDILSTSDPAIDIDIPDDALMGAPSADASPMQKMVWDLALFLKQLARQQSDATKLSENLEGIARFVLRQNDERRAQSLLRQLLIDGFVFDQLAVKCADLRVTKLWKGEDKELGGSSSPDGTSPFVFTRIDPRTLYTAWDDLGMYAALQRDVRPYREIRDKYGAIAELRDDLQDDNGNIGFCEYWRRDLTCLWIESLNPEQEAGDKGDRVENYAFIQKPKPNPLGFIPIVTRTCRGDHDSIRPILYNGWKSKIFSRAGVLLTVMFTEAFKQAITQFVRTNTSNADPPMVLDFTAPHVYDLQGGQDIRPLTLPVNAELLRTLGTIRTIQDSTTVSKVIAGQEPGGATAAAAINLLIHGAQLSLSPTKKALEEVYAQMVQMIFKYVRAYEVMYEGKGNVELWTDGGTKRIMPTELPKWLNIDVRLKADLPQDKIVLVNMAAQMAAMRSADGRPLFSRETIQKLVVDDLNAEEDAIDKDMAAKTQQALSPSPRGLSALMAGGALPAGARPGIPAQALAPNVAAGLPVDQNPTARSGRADELARALANAGRTS
jgi:hypothetical protein